MKKLTNLIGALTIVSAMALVGCANPNNNDNGSKVPNISVSDVKKPDSFTSTSNPIKSATEGNAILADVFDEVGKIQVSAQYSVMTTEKFINDNKDLKIAEKEKFDKNEETIKKAEAEGKAYNVTYTDSYKAGVYESDDKNIVYNIIEKMSKETKSDDPVNKKNEYIFDNVDITSLKVLDASKIEVIDKEGPVDTVYKPKFVKTLDANTSLYNSGHMKKEGDKYNVPDSEEGTYNNTVEMHMIIMFEKDGKNGIVEVKGKAIRTDAAPTAPEFKDLSIVFYDINGSEKYTYTQDEAKAAISLLFQH